MNCNVVRCNFCLPDTLSYDLKHFSLFYNVVTCTAIHLRYSVILFFDIYEREEVKLIVVELIYVFQDPLKNKQRQEVNIYEANYILINKFENHERCMKSLIKNKKES